MERRDFLQQIDCFVCNQQEAGLLFSDNYDHLEPEEMCRVLAGNVHSANIPCMVVTMGGKGAVFARANGECGIVPAKRWMSSTPPVRGMPSLPELSSA